MSLKNIVVLTAISFLGITLTSCGSGSNTNSSSQSDLHQVSSGETTKTELPENKDYIFEPRGPLDDFKNSDEDELIISIGEWTHKNLCLQKVGRTNNDAKPTLDSSKPKIWPTIDYNWGIVSLENAKENGYRPGSEHGDLNGQTEGVMSNDGKGNTTTRPYKDDDEKESYLQSGACSKEYDNAESKSFDFHLTDDEDKKDVELITTPKTQAKSDTRVLSKVKEWSTCMKSAGFDYATPQEASSFAWPAEEPEDQEKRTAIKDFECKKSTGLMDVWYEVLHEKQRILIDQYRPILEKEKNHDKKRVEFAQKVIANNGKLD
ncbi:MAG: hypothetical protein LBI63_06140 [Candidatus Ancillula sp.]|nr:hypothetical protein [Candidatus Ancillula sp.]